MQEWLQLQVGIPHLQIVAVTQQELPVAKHPQIALAVVKRPYRVGQDCSLRQLQNHRADFAFFTGVSACAIAVNQAGNAKRKQQMVFVEEIKRCQAVAQAKIERGRRSETERFNGDREGGLQSGADLGCIVGPALLVRAGGSRQRKQVMAVGLGAKRGANGNRRQSQRHSRTQPNTDGSKQLRHRYLFSRKQHGFGEGQKRICA